jgi:hypothetical protein
MSFRRKDRTLPLSLPVRTLFGRPIDSRGGVLRQMLFLLVRNLTVPQMIPPPSGERNDPLTSRLEKPVSTNGWLSSASPMRGSNHPVYPTSARERWRG